jgi:HNH endonuclease
VAHIYPFCRLKDSEEDIFGARHTFWNHLKNFWPEEKVAAWEAELFPAGLSESGGEIVHNLITLSKGTHIYWNRGAFALKPISICDNNTTLKVQFFWQKKQNNTQAAMSLLTIPLSTEDLDYNEGAFDNGDTKLYYEDKRIKSGQIFELKTDDSIKKPLPSFKLLELQWFLTRVVGMAGAAFPYEAGWGHGSDDNDEVPCLDLDDRGDISLLSDLNLPSSPEFLRKVNQLPVESSKHHMEEAEGESDSMGVTAHL